MHKQQHKKTERKPHRFEPVVGIFLRSLTHETLQLQHIGPKLTDPYERRSTTPHVRHTNTHFAANQPGPTADADAV